MKLFKSSQLISVALGCGLVSTASFAFPGAGAGGQLDAAARNLTAATQNLVYLLQSVEANSDAYQEAVTLLDAAQIFQDRVEFNPDDLGVDFNTIEATYDSLRQEFLGCHAYANNPNVKTAWINIEQANLNLRLDWLSCGQGGSNQPPSGYPAPGSYPAPGGYPPPGGWDHSPGGWHGGDHRPGGYPDRGGDHRPGGYPDHGGHGGGWGEHGGRG